MSKVKDIWQTGYELREMADSLKCRKVTERIKMAELLEHIGHVINSTYRTLSIGQFPTGNQRRIEMLSEDLFYNLSFVVGEMRAKTLSEKIMTSHRAGLLHGMVTDKGVNQTELQMLREAATNFIETSKVLREYLN